MKKIVKLVVIIMLLFNGIAKEGIAQVSVQIFPLSASVQKEATKLEQFFTEGNEIIRYDSGNKISFVLKLCPEKTLSLYFPAYDKETGKRVDCCPVLTLFARDGKYFTDDLPNDRKTYSPEESEKQITVLKKALLLLQQKQNQKM